MTDQELPGLTIDDKTTRDIDDAVAVERLEDGWRVRVSIADVSRRIKLDSELDKKAMGRVATRYYGTGNSPMFPRFLAERDLSLWPGEKRGVMVIDLNLGTDFETRKVDIYESVFRSQAKLTYEEVPAIIADPKHSYHQLLSSLKILALGLLAKRRKKGAMVMYDLNNGWVTTEDGFLKKLENKDAVIGYIIIQEMMILANAEVAKYSADHHVALLYRNHQAKDAGPELEALAKTIQEGFDHPIEGLDELRKSTHQLLEKANYSSSLKGHFGLSLPAYAHFTSPIRRYADLVNHRQIKAALRHDKMLPYTVDQIQQIADHINAMTLQEQQSRSEFEKQKAEQRAVRAIDARRLHGLKAKDFERAVKVEARSGEDASDAFIEGYVRRVQDGTLPILCMTVVFGEAPESPGWNQVKSWTIARLWKRPEEAVSVLSQGVQVVGWPAVEYDVSEAGPPHERVFTAVARMGENQAQALAKTSKEAKQRASVKLLAKLAGVEEPIFDEPKFEAPAPVPPPPPVSTSENAVGVLQQFCQKRGLDSPGYTFQQTGPSHMPVITCTCKFQNVERTAVATSKKDAKQKAAQAVLAALK